MADTDQQAVAELALPPLQSQTPWSAKGAGPSVLRAPPRRGKSEVRGAERSASQDSTTTEKKKTCRPYLEGDVLNNIA